MTTPADSTPFLAADIGASSVRFGLAQPNGRLAHVVTYPSDEFDGIAPAVEFYLDQVGMRPDYAGIAVASTVLGDQIKLTNSNWTFSIEALRKRLGLKQLLAINDFAALAWSVREMHASDVVQIGRGNPERDMPIGLVGARSGLGVSGLIHANGSWAPLTGEGGHASFSPHDELEMEILRRVRRRYGDHVSAERLISSHGLSLIHQILAEQAGGGAEPLGRDEICRHALGRTDDICLAAVNLFCAMLGTVAGNIALTLGARGGIYIGGGLVRQLQKHLPESPFRQRFESKGRLSPYLVNIPTNIISNASASLTGVAVALHQSLQSGMLRRIRASVDDLSPAERAVANIALRQPRFMLDAAVSEIARAAKVSQPTVIRFCRSLGCDSLAEFRRRLTQSLSTNATTPLLPITPGDSGADIVGKVFDGMAAALARNRDEIAGSGTQEAINLLAGASKIMIFGMGISGSVAEGGASMFLRYGIHVSAYRDIHTVRVAAGVSDASAAVIVLSASELSNELLAAVSIAKDNKASVLIVAPTTSPLAKMADVLIPTDFDEDLHVFSPNISGAIQLLIVEALAIGVALKSPQNATAAYHRAELSLKDKFMDPPQSHEDREAEAGPRKKAKELG